MARSPREVNRYIAGLPAATRATAGALVRTVRQTVPQLSERLYMGVPAWFGPGRVCYIAAHRDHVNLGFFAGRRLPDPRGLLEGTGASLRHVKVRSVTAASGVGLRALLRAAAELPGTAPSRRGPGPIRRAGPPARPTRSSSGPSGGWPPPRPDAARRELERQMAGLPGLERRASRFGHAFAYFTGDREIAHFHGDHRLDVRLTRELIRQRKKEGGIDPRIRTRGPSADWAAVRIEEPTDVSLALTLVEEALRANG
jgi:hypothetical protein